MRLTLTVIFDSFRIQVHGPHAVQRLHFVHRGLLILFFVAQLFFLSLSPTSFFDRASPMCSWSTCIVLFEPKNLPVLNADFSAFASDACFVKKFDDNRHSYYPYPHKLSWRGYRLSSQMTSQ